MYSWMNKLVMIHGGIKTGQDEQVMEFNEIGPSDGSDDDDDELASETEVEFEGYDFDKLSE